MSVKPGSETQALWQDYRKTRDQALRDRLILTYAPLVKFVAGRLGATLPAHVDEQDLVSYGLLGLIGAIERFDPDREIKFETYAISRIKGAIIDELRSLDWVPRSVRTRAREIERCCVNPRRDRSEHTPGRGQLLGRARASKHTATTPAIWVVTNLTRGDPLPHALTRAPQGASDSWQP